MVTGPVWVRSLLFVVNIILLTSGSGLALASCLYVLI